MGYLDIAFIFVGIGLVQLLAEYLQTVFVYNNKAALEAVERLEPLQRNVAVVESKLATATGNQAKSLQRDLERLRNEVMVVSQAKMGATMRGTLLTAAVQFGTFYLFSTLYADKAVATLPFTPTWGYFNAIFRRGLGAHHAPNAASYLPFVISANMMLRPLVAKLAGTEAKAKQFNSGPSLTDLSTQLGDQWLKPKAA